MKLDIKKEKNKILCIGDIILDTYLKGDVNRISPEAPIPVLKLSDEINTIGGCGNVSRNICSAGGFCHLISVVGNDLEADVLKNLLKEWKNLSFDLIKDNTRCTTKKERYVSGNQQILRVDKEENSKISQNCKKLILQKFKKVISYCSIVVISDYNKGILDESLLSQIIGISKKKKKIVIVDPKRNNFEIYKNADLITPNLKELLIANNVQEEISNTDKLVENLSKQMIRKYFFSNIITTRSSKGMTIISKGRQIINLSSEAKEVFDVSGAGDTVVAYLAVELARGKNIIEAAKIANTAAGIAVGKFGTASVKRNELKKKEPAGKILSLTEALNYLKEFGNKKVGFTNGCFDLFHKGHLEFLRKARSECDFLILGLNSDSSIKKLKGPNRPIMSQDERALLLANFPFIDLIIIFNEKTPINLIKSIKPMILFKGKDYKLNEVVGADEVINFGGEIVLLDLIKGKSTSSIIKRIKNGS